MSDDELSRLLSEYAAGDISEERHQVLQQRLKSDSQARATFREFMDLEASDEQLDAPFLYAVGRDGWASEDPEAGGGDLTPLFEKIVDDLANDPGPDVPIMALSRVNEPFLDPRLFGFARYVTARLPETRLRYFTNATPMTDAVLDELLALENTASIKISLNDHRPTEYEKTMSLPFHRAHESARRLHRRASTGHPAGRLGGAWYGGSRHFGGRDRARGPKGLTRD